MELTFLDFGIELVVAQDLEDSADVVDVARGVL